MARLSLDTELKMFLKNVVGMGSRGHVNYFIRRRREWQPFHVAPLSRVFFSFLKFVCPCLHFAFHRHCVDIFISYGYTYESTATGQSVLCLHEGSAVRTADKKSCRQSLPHTGGAGETLPWKQSWGVGEG